MFEWQEIRRSGRRLKRTPVSDGWIVVSDYGFFDPGRVRFVPDPDHQWDGSPTEPLPGS